MPRLRRFEEKVKTSTHMMGGLVRKVDDSRRGVMKRIFGDAEQFGFKTTWTLDQVAATANQRPG